MLKISLPVWEYLPFLNLIQFPLRFQAISIFSASIAAALLVKYLPFKKILFVSLLMLVLYANRNHWNINEKFDPGENYYLDLKTTSTTYGEHLPKWGRAMDKLPVSKLEFIEGKGNIKVIEDKSNKILASVQVLASSKLRLNQFYFPGWDILVDNKKTSFSYLTDGQNYGLPVFEIEAGSHKILAEFKNTSLRNFADLISIITFITVIMVILNQCKLLIRR